MSNTADTASEPMSETIAATWLTYVGAWNAQSQTDRERLLSEVTATNSHYNDPNVELKGHKALADYMAGFHKQMPGAHFVLTRFISHHQQSIACWNLCDSSGNTVFTGISYGTYDARGKLTAERGFFDTTDIG